MFTVLGTIKGIPMKKYYYISFLIELGGGDTKYFHELIDTTPFEYVVYWKKLGGDYSDRVILFAQEISEDEYKCDSGLFEE